MVLRKTRNRLSDALYVGRINEVTIWSFPFKKCRKCVLKTYKMITNNEIQTRPVLAYEAREKNGNASKATMPAPKRSNSASIISNFPRSFFFTPISVKSTVLPRKDQIFPGI